LRMRRDLASWYLKRMADCCGGLMILRWYISNPSPPRMYCLPLRVQSPQPVVPCGPGYLAALPRQGHCPCGRWWWRRRWWR
jgi:hypothetical protein